MCGAELGELVLVTREAFLVSSDGAAVDGDSARPWPLHVDELGAVLGAIVLTWLQVNLSDYTTAWQLYLGLFFMAIVLYAPGGLAGLIMMHVPMLRTRAFAGVLRSYAVALTFLQIRVILGVFSLDQPLDWHIVETVVWSCVASSVLIGDIANQLYEGHLARLRAAGNAGDLARPRRIAAAGG